eukprot:scaffold220897_cov19-Tisochrysis_lutea.AAC.1
MPYSYFWETHQRRCCVPVVLCTWPRFELDDTGAPYKRWEERDRHSAAVWSTHVLLPFMAWTHDNRLQGLWPPENTQYRGMKLRVQLQGITAP